MKFSDLVALAKAGYSPKDVKDLLEMCETDPATKEADVSTVVEETKKEDTTNVELNAFEKLVSDNEKKGE